jgi:hypothetical protein
MPILDSLRDFFVKKGQHLFWKRLPAQQVHGGYQEEPIENDQAYFVLRVKEMYLQHTRVLWRKFYPMLHGSVKYGSKEEVSVTGPGQLKELGDSNLDRVINLNHRVAGPIPFKGDDVTVVVGLYAVPGQDATKALIDTVGKLAALGGVALGQALEITNIVKVGVEGILGLGQTSLSLGVEDTFYKGNPFRSGLYVGISAPSTEINLNELWLRDGQLVKGRDPIIGKPYVDYDYMILEVERRPSREDWPSLPVIAEFNEQFAAVMRDSSLEVKGKRARLKDLWPQFTQAVAESPHLISADRAQIEVSVSTDLTNRLDAIENNNPFETKAWGNEAVRSKPPTEFDFIDVPDYLDLKDSVDVRRQVSLLGQNPFDS